MKTCPKKSSSSLNSEHILGALRLRFGVDAEKLGRWKTQGGVALKYRETAT